MILNISGRTDVVAFYTEWLINRVKAGFVDVRNPFYPKLVNRIYFNDVDIYVFCTKNPIPIIPYINIFSNKPILFQITLTPYGKDIEPNVIDKKEIINAVKELSEIIGKKSIYIRYDPIFINKKYTLSFHIKAFEKLCSQLQGYVETMIVSFLDLYKNTMNNIQSINPYDFNENMYEAIGTNFSNIANKYNMSVQTCSEERTLFEYGFLKGNCVEPRLVEELTGKKFKERKGRNNKYCHCPEMVDIGSYNSCMHLCKYCYANYDEKSIKSNILFHNVNSSLLIGELKKEDIIKIRK